MVQRSGENISYMQDAVRGVASQIAADRKVREEQFRQQVVKFDSVQFPRVFNWIFFFWNVFYFLLNLTNVLKLI